MKYWLGLAGAVLAAILIMRMFDAFSVASRFDLQSNPPVALSLCNAAGNACCGPDADVGTPHCHTGLGCDVTTNTCAVCGAPGQPCCDGHFTGFSLRGYTGPLLDPTERIESCNAGARCDARLAPDGRSWLGTRTCIGCGSTEGGACCAPDVRYALGRCSADAATGKPLVCDDPWAGDRGVCVACGNPAGAPACLDGEACADGLVEVDDRCQLCGLTGYPTCDRGAPCRDGISVPEPRTGVKCVPAGKEGQLCKPNGFCDYADLRCNAANTCETCGGYQQACCTSRDLTCREGGCTNGRCMTKPRRMICDEYARTAVAQAQEYFARECGDPSDRWQTSYDNHFHWCLGPDGDIADRETRAREGELSRCRTLNPLPDGEEQPLPEACAFTAILTVDQCYNADGSPSWALDPNTSTFTGCGDDEDSATDRAKIDASGAVFLSDDPAPNACTYDVDVMPGCYCQ